MKKMLTLVFGALLAAGPAYAQTADAAGTWDLNITTPNGPVTAALTLKKDGEKLTGSIASPQGEVEVQGIQKDKAVTVNFTVQTPNGPFAIAMNGTQEGDAIAGTMEFGEWSGKRRGGMAGAAATTGTVQADKPADVSGAWAIVIDLGGQTGTPTVTLKQDGEKLTGTYSSQVLGEQQLTGTIKGNDITFGFQASFDGNAVKVTYTGTVDKDTMKGSVSFGDMGGGTFTGKKK
jgi:hypothetical protein